MENSKEVKNIADHQEQHPVEAPPHQGYPPADNPMQPPELQRLPMEEKGEESKASSELNQAWDGKPKECCCCSHCCLRGLQMDSVIQWCAVECNSCCFTPCLFICACMAGVIWICCNGCSDSLYK